MRTIPSGLATQYAAQDSTLATAIKITYQDPILGMVTTGFTTGSQDAVISGVTYLATASTIPTTLASQTGTTGGSSEFAGFFVIGAVIEADILAGKFDGATFEVFVYNWANLADGIDTIYAGTLGDVRIEGRSYIFEVREITDKLTQNIVELLSQDCRADFGDTRCKVALQPPIWQASTAYINTNTVDASNGHTVRPTTQNRRIFRCQTTGTSGGSEPSWNLTIDGTTNDGTAVWRTLRARTLTGTVSGVTSNQIFTDSAITEPDNWFRYGVVTWLTGANQGRRMEVKTQTGTSITLFLPMISTISIGDTYSVTAGCDKAYATCKTVFENIYNFQGEPHKGTSAILYSYATR